jgi:hypothetical protein
MTAAARPHRRTAGAAVRLCVCALLLSCTDPRARPVAPMVSLLFGSSIRVTSPGLIEGVLYAYDADGIQKVVETLRTPDSILTDSTFLLGADQEITQSIALRVPRGLAIGAELRVLARVTDWVNFVTADSVVFSVQDTLPSGSLHSR